MKVFVFPLVFSRLAILTVYVEESTGLFMNLQILNVYLR
jgi:hypothetical protein